MNATRQYPFICMLVLVLSGCIPPPADGMRGLQPYLDEPIDSDLAWRERPPDEERFQRTEALLSEPLSMDEAVEVALLNHPGLQANLQTIDIVESTLREATVLRNPELAAESYVFEVGRQEPRLESFLSFELSALLERRSRTRAASFGIESTRAQVAAEVITFVDRVRRAWIRYVASIELLEQEHRLWESAQSDGQAAEVYVEQGLIQQEELLRARAFIAQARQDLLRAENHRFQARQNLHDLLGIDVYETLWTVPTRLPEPPEEIPTTEYLEARALQRNMVLHQFYLRRQEQDALLSVAYLRRWVPRLSLGISLDFDRDGAQVGPAAAIGLPIFNRFRHTRDALQAEEIQIGFAQLQETRRVHFETRRIEENLHASHRAARQYPDEILPLHEELVEETHRHYQEERVGIFRLLEARRNQLRAERDYVQARKDFWLAGASFEYLISGGPTVDADPGVDVRHIEPFRIEGVRQRPR